MIISKVVNLLSSTYECLVTIQQVNEKLKTFADGISSACGVADLREEVPKALRKLGAL